MHCIMKKNPFVLKYHALAEDHSFWGAENKATSNMAMVVKWNPCVIGRSLHGFHVQWYPRDEIFSRDCLIFVTLHLKDLTFAFAEG